MAEIISTLADISTIWLVCLTFVLCLIPLVVVGAMVYGMRKLLAGLPPVLEGGRKKAERVAVGADAISNRVAAPFIAASALTSRVKGTGRSIRQMIRRKA